MVKSSSLGRLFFRSRRSHSQSNSLKRSCAVLTKISVIFVSTASSSLSQGCQTFTATFSPDLRQAKWTYAIEALLMGSFSNFIKISSIGQPSCVSIVSWTDSQSLLGAIWYSSDMIWQYSSGMSTSSYSNKNKSLTEAISCPILINTPAFFLNASFMITADLECFSVIGSLENCL